ncbi:MAG: glycosyltransferase, partial [Verrucomicrobiae bacterium]|nr:glycosyltransferase [Verrucomicrobiae bacterium]
MFQHAVGQGERPGTTQLQLGVSKRISFRVRFYTQSYPHPENPIAGAFNRHIARALRSQVYLEVVVPISHFEARRLAPMLRWQDGLLIRHPRFLGIRGLNRIFAGCSLAQALQGRPCRAEILMASPAWPEGYAVVRRARECKRPCIVNVIGSDVNRLPPWGPRRSQTLWALRNCDHIYAVSFALRERLIALGIPASRITVIHNGVDERLFFPRPAEPVRRELGLPVARRVLLFAGNVIHEKGADDLLEALASIRREQRPLLLLVGPCPEPMRYGQLIRRLGLQADCQLVGRQDQSQMPKWYAACDLFVLPSWHEGCPNVILEALACGRPIVATNVGGIPELLNPTTMPFARLVAPHDPAALASAIVELLGRSW